MCEELTLACTIQMRRYETIINTLNANQGDAAIACDRGAPDMRSRVDFTDPYYCTPARFVARRDSPIDGAVAGEARRQARGGRRQHRA